MLFHNIYKLLTRPLELTTLTGSLQLFKVLVTQSTTTKNGLMVSIRAKREAHEKFKIRHVKWVK